MNTADKKGIILHHNSEEEAPGKVSGVLDDVVRKIEKGVYRKEVWLDKVFKLETVGQAHEYMEETTVVGIVVVTIPWENWHLV